MHSTQEIKVVQGVKPGAIVDNAAFTGVVIDTLGFEDISIVIQFGAMDIAMAALKITECATSGGSYTDITGADFSVSPATLPSATEDDHLFGVHINLQNRQRYLKIAATGGDGTAGTYMSAIALLSRGKIVPSDATSRGFTQDLTVVK